MMAKQTHEFFKDVKKQKKSKGKGFDTGDAVTLAVGATAIAIGTSILSDL